MAPAGCPCRPPGRIPGRRGRGPRASPRQDITTDSVALPVGQDVDRQKLRLEGGVAHDGEAPRGRRRRCCPARAWFRCIRPSIGRAVGPAGGRDLGHARQASACAGSWGPVRARGCIGGAQRRVARGAGWARPRQASSRRSGRLWRQDRIGAGRSPSTPGHRRRVGAGAWTGDRRWPRMSVPSVTPRSSQSTASEAKHRAGRVPPPVPRRRVAAGSCRAGRGGRPTADPWP
jgi:hypothetical protein